MAAPNGGFESMDRIKDFNAFGSASLLKFAGARTSLNVIAYQWQCR